MKILSIIMALLAGSLSLMAQDDIQKLRHFRYDYIDYYHVDVGIEAGANQNTYSGVNVAIGRGTFRNFVVTEAGLRYTMCNPIKMNGDEGLSVSHAAIFLSGHLNLLRGQKGSAYLGAEAAYNLGVSSSHHGVSRIIRKEERDFYKPYASVRGKLGVMVSRWNIAAYGQYNLAPQMNQKYVFETDTFDYDLLHDSLFERLHFGLSISYYFPL